MNISFILTGTKFYMEYILPTNCSTKNPIYKMFLKQEWGIRAYNYKIRFNAAIGFFIIHFILAIIFLIIGIPFIVNLLVNIYPCLVQIFIGYRVYRIIKLKKLRLRMKHFDGISYLLNICSAVDEVTQRTNRRL